MAAPGLGSTPAVLATGASRQATNTTSHPITLPTHAAGNSIIVIFGCDGSATTTATSGWRLLTTVQAGGNRRLSVYWRIATGASEAITVTTSASEASNALIYVLDGSRTPIANWDTGANPPGVRQAAELSALAIAAVVADADVVATAQPSGYGTLLTSAGAASSSDVSLSAATKSITAQVEDPGTFTTASGIVCTIIAPAAAETSVDWPYMLDVVATPADISSSLTSWPISMPLHDVGDLLVAEIWTDSTYTLTTSGWTTEFSQADSTRNKLTVAYLVATSDAETLTAVTSSAGYVTAIVRSFRNHNGIAASASVANGSSAANADPPNCNPGVADDYLWLAGMCLSSSATTASAAPSGYSGLAATVQGSFASVGGIASAIKYANASSEDPGAFTSPASFWTAYTLAIAPPSGGAVICAGDGTLEFTGDATCIIPPEATGAGTLEFIGAGTAWHGLESISAIGAGTLSFIGAATMLAPATAIGAGSLSFIGDATGFVAPASSALGAIEFIGDGIGVCAVIVEGAGSLSFTGAGVVGVGVSAIGAGTLEFVGAGGYYPIAVGDGALEFTGAASGNVGNDARGRWLRIHTAPLSQVYAIDAIRGRLDPRESMHKCAFEVTPTAAQLGARNDTFGVTLNGSGSRLRARLVAQAAYGVRIDVMDGGTVSRSGVTSGIQLGDEIELDCEADGWASLLPHRTNADLGLFRDVEVLPWRYGREVPGRCVRLDAAGRVWLWADHASQRIRSVQIDGQDFDAWQWRNEANEYGQPVTLILTDGVDEGVEMTAVGDGALDEIGGHLIVNPADMLMSLCARGGVTLSRGATAEFRAECLARSIEVSGTIGAMSLQQSLVLLSESIYAVFSRELAGVMRLLPRTGTARTIAPRYTPTASAERPDVATRLRVRYALDDDDAPRASADLRASAVEALRGVTLAEYTLPLVRDGRTAADVATRMLQDMSRPSYTVPIDRQRARVVPGDLVSVSVPRYGLAGDAVVRSASIADDGSTPVALLRHGAAPSVTLTQMSSAYSPEQHVSGTVSTQSDVRRITIRSEDGRPIVGARCTLNGSLTRVTDAGGVVEFPVSAMPAGQHVITIIADGLEPMRLDVVV